MKKGASPIIATVLLIGITITLAYIILLWGNMFFVTLSPPVNCDNLRFQAGVFEDGNLDIFNSGNEEIYGITIKEVTKSSTKILEEIKLEKSIKPGHSYTRKGDYPKNIILIPIIKEYNDGEGLIACPDSFGIKLGS